MITKSRPRYPGMQHVSLSSPIGMPEAVMLEEFQWVAEEVMPAFKPAGDRAGGGTHTGGVRGKDRLSI